MPSSPLVPDELRAGPFRSGQALSAGLSRRQLQSDCWRHMLHDVYAWVELPDDLALRMAAAALILPAGAAFSHRTAAWLHRVDALSPESVPVATVPPGTAFSARDGLVVRQAPLRPGEISRRRGLPVTSPTRTAFDLARTEPGSEAVACVDAFLHAGLVDHADLTRYVDGQRGWRGVRLARRAVELADAAAESPMESRLRMILVDGGLPRPVVNAPLYDRHGVFLGRPDLRIAHVLIEYDGVGHREADVFGHDLRRQNGLVDGGYVVLRYGAGDIGGRAHLVVAQVRRALATSPPILVKSTSTASPRG